MSPPFSKITECEIGPDVQIVGWANLYQSKIAAGAVIGPFVEIGGAIIGARTKVSSHTYICPHVEIGADCFIAHNVTFTNDTFETPAKYSHIDELGKQWTVRRTVVGNCVRIGSGAVIKPVRIGDNAIIGAGAVVCHDVPAGATVKGIPAR